MSLSLIPRNRAWTAVVPRYRDAFFDDLWNGFARVPASLHEGPGRFVPNLDVAETDEEYRVTAELPGLSEKDFEVVLEDNVLTLKGEKTDQYEKEEGGHRRAETHSGRFERRIRFEGAIAEEDVKAAYKNGVLTVTLPKPPEARPQVRSIPIETS